MPKRPVNNVWMNNKAKDRFTRRLKGRGWTGGRRRSKAYQGKKSPLLN